MNHTRRKARLETLLLDHQGLWRPQPFKIETPDWCPAYPALTAELLALDDAAVDRLSADNGALIGLLAEHVPALAELAELIELPLLPSPSGGGAGGEGAALAPGTNLTTAEILPPPPTGEGASRLYTDIPGRKQAQIEAYAAALHRPRAPVLEWCAGKGHLGRLLAHRWHWPVASLEIDAELCDAGEDLARRAKVDCMQHFIRADALATASARHLTGRHAVALHACGDLHTRLIAAVAAGGGPAMDVAPCCYYRTEHETYRPFAATPLRLSRDDLRLAVTETVTASAKQRRRSRQALAWKLGWVELRRHLTGETGYRNFPPVPEAWLRGDFATFVERMRERERGFCGRGLVPQGDFLRGARAALECTPHPQPLAPEGRGEPKPAHFEALGQARAARMLRLQLARLAFRRPLEVWLLMDMAVFLENQGYTVTVGPFCAATLTPRNLLLSARR